MLQIITKPEGPTENSEECVTIIPNGDVPTTDQPPGGRITPHQIASELIDEIVDKASIGKFYKIKCFLFKFQLHVRIEIKS